MAIGVSYNGHKMSASSAAELQQIMAKHGSEMIGQKFASRRQKQPSVPKMEPFDPVDGPLVGIEGNDSQEPDGMSRSVGSKGGWRMECSRVEISIKPSLEMKCNEVTLVKLAYQVIFSEKGLAKGRTPEKEVWRKSFFVISDGGSGNGKYGSRLFFDNDGDDAIHPLPTAIAFGSEENLDTFNEETKRFACNYDSYGRPLADPPVKVVAVNEYTGGLD